MIDTLESVEFTFWTKSVLCLQTAKEAFHNYVKNTLNRDISSWSDEERSSIEQFVNHVNNRTARFKYVEPSASKAKSVGWKCTCCECCEKVFKKLLLNQQIPRSRNIAWKCNRKVSSVQERRPTEAQNPPNRIIKGGVEYLFWRTDKGFYVEVRDNKNDHEFTKWNPKDQQTSQVKTFDYYWSMANVFMCKSADDIQCPCPEETDISMFFNMMKNCKLFSLKQEGFRYQQVLAARNQLMHSPRLQVSKLEMKSIFENTKALLMLFQHVDDCKEAVEKIEKLFSKELLISAVNYSQNLEFKQDTKAALEISVKELGIDITIAKNAESDASLLEESAKLTEDCLRCIETMDFNSPKFETVRRSAVHEHKVTLIDRRTISRTNLFMQAFKVADMCLLSDGRIALTDQTDSKLKMITKGKNDLDFLTITGGLHGVCQVNEISLAVTLTDKKEIVFVEILPTLKRNPERIKVKDRCTGIEYSEGLLYVCCTIDHGSICRIRIFSLPKTAYRVYGPVEIAPTHICSDGTNLYLFQTRNTEDNVIYVVNKETGNYDTFSLPLMNVLCIFSCEDQKLGLLTYNQSQPGKLFIIIMHVDSKKVTEEIEMSGDDDHVPYYGCCNAQTGTAVVLCGLYANVYKFDRA